MKCLSPVSYYDPLPIRHLSFRIDSLQDPSDFARDPVERILEMTDSCSRSHPTSKKKRREFLKNCGSVLVAGSTGLLSSCTSPVRSYRVDKLGKIVISIKDFPELSQAGGVIKVEVPGLLRVVYLRRLADGRFTALSGVCTHQGCLIAANRFGFKCPCHGSAYTAEGAVSSGPASEDLQKFDLQVYQDSLHLNLPG